MTISRYRTVHHTQYFYTVTIYLKFSGRLVERPGFVVVFWDVLHVKVWMIVFSVAAIASAVNP